MTKRWICECDLCGAQMDEHKNYILEIRPDLPQNQVGTVESWDICPTCKETLLEFFKTRKKQDEPHQVPPSSDIPMVYLDTTSSTHQE